MALAGAAQAEIAISGYAEMGVKDDATNTRFHSDIDLTFKLSGETDGGLSFGASIDLDEVAVSKSTSGAPAKASDPVNREAVWIKGSFGTLTLGDTDGAFDWAMTEVGMLTALADDHTSHGGYSGNSGLDGSSTNSDNGLIARYDYSFGDFAVGLSAELDSDVGDDNIFGLGAKWSGDMGAAKLALGLGYQTNGVRNVVGVSAKASTNGFDVVLNYSDLDGQTPTAKDSHMAIGVGYTTGALGLTANYGTYELVNGDDAKGYGVAANYDLGGGAVVMAGYGKTDGGNSTWSAGLGLSF